MPSQVPEKEALNKAKANALELMACIKKLWKNANDNPHNNQLDWSKLAGINTDTVEVFYDQYFRANVLGSELYVQTVANSTRYRILDTDPGFGRLYLAGDWTKNGGNLGMVESATMSGMRVSRAITGQPEQISGQNDFY